MDSHFSCTRKRFHGQGSAPTRDVILVGISGKIFAPIVLPVSALRSNLARGHYGSRVAAVYTVQYVMEDGALKIALLRYEMTWVGRDTF